ncbi:hypothetical protein GE21DRAFT_6893 [Neurospora crassa]|uniref:Uncharacterized protein n=1 Tax=Neurospora crassa (strain ATCC 24698 / 74-OR23-1A / CBS 708.71 / DSM 1257 / FGSC 987) TaxID=367110 RepID=Q7S107_NEUCR|nr:hypothetical protein NCU07764 [Neurospora crassa OR74A]EAA29022.1 hypothetical protein NCU07764 [Neurospora crassa OR74A]KHE85036.1 hypothetical protein GE21DRAFT_6893 [Neurospora crassa]|eukprot:XP_958258.1 hypothetical protein NCU07764 [Neurospora crassa OR74A]
MVDGQFHVQAFSIQQPGSRWMLLLLGCNAMISGEWQDFNVTKQAEAANNTCASWPPNFWRHFYHAVTNRDMQNKMRKKPRPLMF